MIPALTSQRRQKPEMNYKGRSAYFTEVVMYMSGCTDMGKIEGGGWLLETSIFGISPFD